MQHLEDVEAQVQVFHLVGVIIDGGRDGVELLVHVVVPGRVLALIAWCWGLVRLIHSSSQEVVSWMSYFSFFSLFFLVAGGDRLCRAAVCPLPPSAFLVFFPLPALPLSFSPPPKPPSSPLRTLSHHPQPPTTHHSLTHTLSLSMCFTQTTTTLLKTHNAHTESHRTNKGPFSECLALYASVSGEELEVPPSTTKRPRVGRGKMSANPKKAAYYNKLNELCQEYNKIFLVDVTMVGSKQIQDVRMQLRGKAELLFGKNVSFSYFYFAVAGLGLPCHEEATRWHAHTHTRTRTHTYRHTCCDNRVADMPHIFVLSRQWCASAFD